MLKKIKAENYRSFQKLDVDLAPITLFVGPNNSGKSSVISIVRLLSQTIESNDPNVRLLLNGSLGDFGTYKDLIHDNQTKKHLKLSFSIDSSNRDIYFGNNKNDVEFTLTYKYRSAIKEVILKNLISRSDKQHNLTAEFNEDSERFQLRKVGNKLIPPSTANSTFMRGFSVRNFIPRMMISGRDNSTNTLYQAVVEQTRAASRNGYLASKTFQEIDYVGAMRMPPSRTYLYTGERRQKVGANGEHAITMLAMDSIRRGSKSKGIRQGVVKWLTAAGIASDIKVVPLSDRYFEIHVQHPITKDVSEFCRCRLRKQSSNPRLSRRSKFFGGKYSDC